MAVGPIAVVENLVKVLSRACAPRIVAHSRSHPVGHSASNERAIQRLNSAQQIAFRKSPKLVFSSNLSVRNRHRDELDD